MLDRRALHSALELASRARCAVFIRELVAALYKRRIGVSARLTPRRGPRGLGTIQHTA